MFSKNVYWFALLSSTAKIIEESFSEKYSLQNKFHFKKIYQSKFYCNITTYERNKNKLTLKRSKCATLTQLTSNRFQKINQRIQQAN